MLLTLPFGIGAKNWNYSFSDLCGHGAFLMLGLSYLETEIFNLRLFAASGITLSIIFQYYRENPLWIPIRWNTMFLFINGVMIAHILKEEHDVQNIPQEQMQLYNTIFKNRGMKPVDFLHLMSIAQRHELKKGEKLVTNGKQHHHLHLVQHGRLSVHLHNDKGGEKLKDIRDNQFAGAISFLNWQEKPENRDKVKKRIEEHQYHLYYGSEDFTNFFNYIGSLTSGPSESNLMIDTEDVVISNYTTKFTDDKIKNKNINNEFTATYEGALGHADVTAEDDCVVFSWDFIELDELLASQTSLGIVFELCISADVNRKMVSMMAHEI
jgi:CRP-like cAMP-binding protein